MIMRERIKIYRSKICVEVLFLQLEQLVNISISFSNIRIVLRILYFERNRSRFNSLSISVFDCTDEIYPIIEYVFDNFPQVRWIAHLLVLSCLKDRITQRGCYHLRSCFPSTSTETLTTILNVTLSHVFNQRPPSLLINLPSIGRAQLYKPLRKNVTPS